MLQRLLICPKQMGFVVEGSSKAFLKLFHHPLLNTKGRRYGQKTKLLIPSLISVNKTLSVFDSMVMEKRHQAEKTVAIQIGHSSSSVVPPQSVIRTLEICENYGVISKATCTAEGQPTGKNLVVVQFEDKQMAENLLRSCVFECDDGNLPVQSRFLYHSTSKKPKKDIEYVAYESPSDETIRKALFDSSDVSSQMKTLYEVEGIGDFGSRVRFLICQEIEDCLKGLFPVVRALPFGSTINGFGKHDCDLDMFLELGTIEGRTEKAFYFQSKKLPVQGRARTQQTLQLFGDLLQNFSPNVSNVNRIIHARVPIIKFKHDLLGLECDISITNMSGYYMSELLHLYGTLDQRLQPLVFTLRKWASSVGVTSEFPGPWITNFSLSLMAIFFLQNTTPPILPSLKQLKQLGGVQDKRMAADTDCSFCRSSAAFQETSHNSDPLEMLLKRFFQFYLKFNFHEHSISVISGKPDVKVYSSALFIVNPFETDLNVSPNVTSNELTSFKAKAQQALENLQFHGKSSSSSENWGILSLFTQEPVPKKRKNKVTSFQINDVLVKDEQPPKLIFMRPIKRDSSEVQRLKNKSNTLNRINDKLVTTVRGLVTKREKKKREQFKEVDMWQKC